MAKISSNEAVIHAVTMMVQSEHPPAPAAGRRVLAAGRKECFAHTVDGAPSTAAICELFRQQKSRAAKNKISTEERLIMVATVKSSVFFGSHFFAETSRP